MERNEDLDLNLNQHSTDQQEFVEIDLDKFFFTDHVFRELLEERYGKFNLGKNYV